MTNTIRLSAGVLVLALASCLAPRAAASSLRGISVTKGVGAFVYEAALDPNKKQKAPEGGPSLLYLGIAGISCLGAVVVKRKLQKREARSV